MISRIVSTLVLLAGFVLCAQSRSTYRTINGWDRLEIETSGRVTFAVDDSDVSGLSSDGYFSFEQSSGATSHKFTVVPKASGDLERNYFVNGVRQSFDAEAKAWLARALPEYIRESGLQAPERAQRIFKSKGSSGVLAEINKIKSDGSRCTYLKELVHIPNLKVDDLREAARLARRIGSDGEKTNLLIAMAPQFRLAVLRDDYFDAVDSIHSDGEHRRALSVLIENYGIDRDILTRALRSAKNIHSDGEKAHILIDVSNRPLTDEARSAYFRASDSINSDGERRRTLSAVIRRDGQTKETLARALRSAALISSDGEKAGVLVEAVSYYSEDAAVRKCFFDGVGSIHSSGEQRRVLNALLRRPNLAAATVREVAHSAGKISSDGEKGTLLTEIAGLGLNDPGLREEFFLAAKTISSSGVRTQVLMAVLDKAKADKATAIQVVGAARSIPSDGEKARVLGHVAEKYGNDREIYAAIKDAASSISSDGEYRRVMSHLSRNASF